jgi:osmotically-inducible protein OsmY
MVLMKADIELQQSVLDELKWEPIIDASEIGVSVQSGLVTLNGFVKNLAEKWAAERAAQLVAGGKAVTNKLVVNLPEDQQRPDEEIALAASRAIEWNVLISENRINFVVENGCISLHGDVTFQYQKLEAERAVRTLRGLRDLTNDIKVIPVVSATDIKVRIESALERAAAADAQGISIETNGSVVTLRGTVSTSKEREQAERAASTAPGVSEVKNDIRIAA